ncbi:MFS transporter [Methylobacterium sp. CM6257]
MTRIYRKVTRRLVPFLFTCYVAAYLDRVNVGFAKLQMLSDLQFSETVYRLGAGIFFIGYVLFEVPSNMILHEVGAQVWIARVMLSWAVISAAMMFVTSPTWFYVLRFLPGLAEAGLFPGVILYLTYWYPSERRGGIIAPSFVLGFCVLACLDDGIQKAKWLSADEKALLSRNVAADGANVTAHRFRVGFWLPTLIKGAGVSDPLQIGLLTMLPYGAAAVAMITVGRLSDAARERRWHITVPGLVGVVGWLVSIRFSTDLVIAEAALTVATIGVLVTLAQFWCLPTAIPGGGGRRHRHRGDQLGRQPRGLREPLPDRLDHRHHEVHEPRRLHPRRVPRPGQPPGADGAQAPREPQTPLIPSPLALRKDTPCSTIIPTTRPPPSTCRTTRPAASGPRSTSPSRPA